MDEMYSAQQKKKDFIGYWEKNGFKFIEPISVIPPDNWQSTLLMNSGLIRYASIVKEKGKLNESLTTYQPCIKAGSNKFSLSDMMLHDGYFSFFEQLSCGGNGNVSTKWFIEKVLNYLISITNLSIDKIHIGVDSSSSKIKKYWNELGVLSTNIIFPDPKATVLNLPKENIQGNYSSFHYDRGINHPLSCGKNNCNINCKCDRFLEIGDIGIIFLGKTRFIDHGIGLERITSIQNGLLKVTDIEELSSISSLLEKELLITSPHLLTITDHLRSSILLLSLKIKPGNKKREYVLRNLIRRIFWLFSGIYGFNKGKIQDIYSQTITKLNVYLPYLEINQEIVISEINKEIILYEKILTKGGKILKKHFKNHKKISDFRDEELINLYQTYGLPKEIVEILLIENQ